MNQGEDITFEENLAKDVLEIITVFSARLYGLRSRKNQRLIEGMKKVMEDVEKPTQTSIRRQLNAIKRKEFPSMLEVTKNAPQMAIIHLGQAFQNFFTGRAKYPTFKKKGIHDSFTLTNDQFAVCGKEISIPNLGWVRMREKLRFSGEVMSATVSRQADRWFVSITVDTQDVPPTCKS